MDMDFVIPSLRIFCLFDIFIYFIGIIMMCVHVLFVSPFFFHSCIAHSTQHTQQYNKWRMTIVLFPSKRPAKGRHQTRPGIPSSRCRLSTIAHMLPQDRNRWRQQKRQRKTKRSIGNLCVCVCDFCKSLLVFFFYFFFSSICFFSIMYPFCIRQHCLCIRQNTRNTQSYYISQSWAI